MSRIRTATATRGPSPSHSPPDMTFAPGAGIAHGLGWFSVGLGLTQLFAPEFMCRITGVRRTELMQCCGLREVVSGIAVLGCSRPTMGMWTRVAGDVMDLAILTEAMVDNDHDGQIRAMEAAAAVAGVTALDLMAASGLSTAQSLEG